MTVLKLELPFPPGVNTLYGVRAVIVKGRPMAFPYKTHEHRAYLTQAKLAALEAGLTDGPKWPKPASVAMLVRLYRPRRAGDIDGPLKTLLDVLQGIVFENDDQVARLEVYRHDDKARPRVEIEVTELAAEQPEQPALDLGGLDAAPPPKVVHRTKPVPPPMPQSLEQRLRNLARPATITHRSDE